MVHPILIFFLQIGIILLQTLTQDLKSPEKLDILPQRRSGSLITRVQTAYDAFSFFLGNFISDITAKYFSTITHYVSSPYKTKERFLTFDISLPSKIGFFNDLIDKQTLKKVLSEVSMETTEERSVDVSDISWFDEFVKNKKSIAEHGNEKKSLFCLLCRCGF
jgi:hypothetical protein